MQDPKGQFNEFATKSTLFRGRADWYYCYLKTERLAQVLWVLAASAPQQDLVDATRTASKLPEMLLGLAAQEVSTASVLKGILSAISALNIAGVKGVVRKENVSLLVEEYELIARKVGGAQHPSPYIVSSDLEVGGRSSTASDNARIELNAIKDMSFYSQSVIQKTSKNVLSAQVTQPTAMPQSQPILTSSDRALRILELVENSNGVSIKDLVSVVQGCSEKTIQRELVALVSAGKIRKVGERRWSQYLPVKSIEN